MTRASFPQKPEVRVAHGGQSRNGSHRCGSPFICERYYQLSYGKRLRKRITPERMLRGTLMHTCLAYHYGPDAEIQPDFLHKPVLQALKEDSEGNLDEIRNALQCLDAYQLYYSGDPWEPVLVETELEATVKEIDPEGSGPEDSDIVTCRPDLIVRENQDLVLADHKTTGGFKKRLEPINPSYDPFPFRWQLHFNWAICNTEKNRALLGGPVEKVKIQRVKLTEPFDFDRHYVDLAPMHLGIIGKMIRRAVQKEREMDAAIARGEDLLPTGLLNAACENGGFLCDYAPLCGAQSEEGLNRILPIIYK